MIPVATDYHWTPLATGAESDSPGEPRDPERLHYGAEAIDMFGGSGWSPVRDVRVQNWHEVHLAAPGDADPARPSGRR